MQPTENGWDKAKIVALLEANPRAVDRALIRIYERQTADEQRAESTNHNNAIGFSSADARILTSMAKSALHWGGLTDKQRDVVRRRIKKYWRQLLEIAATHPKQAT